MSDMLIGGYTLDELKKIQTAVKKDANKIISDAIDTATAAMEEMLSLDGDDDKDEITNLAVKAQENLELAKVVSNVSDVSYYLPFSTEYTSDGYYYRFESTDVGLDIEAVNSMLETLEDMESNSKMWHDSTC